MKIDLTRKEYRDLLDVLALADWVLHAHKTSDDPRTARYRALEQKFFALAERMGAGDLVQQDTEADQYWPTRAFEDTSAAQAFIREYDNDTFWDELITRLAERDLARQVGGYDRLRQLGPEAYFTRIGPLEKQYGEEFAENGLENLQVVKGPSKASPKEAGTLLH